MNNVKTAIWPNEPRSNYPPELEDVDLEFKHKIFFSIEHLVLLGVDDQILDPVYMEVNK